MTLTIVLVIFVDGPSGWIIDEEVGQGVWSANAAVHDGDAQSVCRIGIEGSGSEQRLFECAVCARERRIHRRSAVDGVSSGDEVRVVTRSDKPHRCDARTCKCEISVQTGSFLTR